MQEENDRGSESVISLTAHETRKLKQDLWVNGEAESRTKVTSLFPLCCRRFGVRMTRPNYLPVQEPGAGLKVL